MGVSVASAQRSLGKFPASPFLVYRQAVWYPSGTELCQAQSILWSGYYRWRSNVPLTLHLMMCRSKICVHYPRDCGKIRVRGGSRLSLLSPLALHCAILSRNALNHSRMIPFDGPSSPRLVCKESKHSRTFDQCGHIKEEASVEPWHYAPL